MKTIWTLLLILPLAAGAQSQVFQGNEFYRNGQFELAEEQYRQALKGDAADSRAQYNLANALYKQKKYAESIRYFQQLASSNPDKSLKTSAWFNAGVAHTHLKDWPAAIEAFRGALRLSPEDNEARENLQKAMLEQKKQQEEQKKKQREQQKNPSKMSRQEAEQRLKQLQEKEKEIQQRLQNRSRQTGSGQSKDW